MSHSKPINPKRKRRVYAAKEPPFPVPIATLTNEAASSSQWFYYTGYLHGDHVVVKHSGDIDFLYKMGFFGKGTMSRSKPEFNKRCRTAQVPDDSGFTVPARLMSRRSYLRRLKWSNTEGTEGDEYDSSQEIIVERADEPESKDLRRENTQHDNMERNVEEVLIRDAGSNSPSLLKRGISPSNAFFLAYGLGSLIVYGENQEKLLLSGMWKIFCQRRKNFVPKYIAYHYYRSKGWVPKSGLKFGSDFVIYKEGPAFYHSSYSVILRMVDSETLTTCTGYPQRDLDWTRLSGLSRVTEHVAKELLICYVLKPSSLSEEEILLPSCISKFKVKEHVVTRWVSSQEREHKQVEDMP
ncbi:hypothetical protein FSP39_020418 [Pinctada imbricata]|uniref:tRNA-splicing endonuclease subunit Sen2 n=1 Tax=Pinctada imbricata TaxID=66713 RepID=A0AA89BV60_PINIB|nr:hypothetical protein FSP39_020418 [Pinctada imbricata]